jgi:hypothetical protein
MGDRGQQRFRIPSADHRAAEWFGRGQNRVESCSPQGHLPITGTAGDRVGRRARSRENLRMAEMSAGRGDGTRAARSHADPRLRWGDKDLNRRWCRSAVSDSVTSLALIHRRSQDPLSGDCARPNLPSMDLPLPDPSRVDLPPFARLLPDPDPIDRSRP